MRDRLSPTQRGLLLLTVGAVGERITETEVVPIALVQLPIFTNTEYVPSPAVVTPAMVGFCVPAEKLFGPLQT